MALRDAMSTVNELKKQIETSKETSEQQQRELMQEKAAVSERLAANTEHAKALQERVSALSTETTAAMLEMQAQRSRADGLQVRLPVALSKMTLIVFAFVGRSGRRA